MDRPRPNPESLEPNEPADSRAEPHDRPAASSSAPEETEPHRHTGDATDPARVESHRNRDDEPTPKIAQRSHDATSAADATDATDGADAVEDSDAADERDDDKAESTTVARPADNSPETDRDISAQLPAKLREQMRQDPTFTRLGWGVDKPTMKDHEEAQSNGSDTVEHPQQESQHASDRRADPTDAESSSAPEGATEDSTARSTSSTTTDPVDERDSAAASISDVSSGEDDGATAHSEDLSDGDGETGPTDSARKSTADLLDEHDRRWDSIKAGLPRGRLPKSAENLDPEVIGRMEPEIRRVLEYQGAAEYIAENADTKPWLEPAVDASPAVQRIFTAVDQGNGHAHIRHGPMGDDQLYADRVAYLEDPAQTDAAKRAAGVDGLNPLKKHRCSWEATRINDATAFAAAFARAVELPQVQLALATPFGPTTDPPDPVKVPITDLLGPEGHKYCTGYRLEGGPQAMQGRKEWLHARAQGEDLTDIPEPKVKRIESFEGGNAIIRFKPNGGGYEISTLFVEPPVVDD
ncbi:hypothetical protein [Kribbella karoonensis]|uniref:Uncharacterized protein n=1 Tax=Kribbella karoonensis TaxID=324851 RepID=A0ABP4PXA2_9ACTN